MTQRWIDQDGELHRLDGPAIIYPGGTEEWHRHGKLHRFGGPAIIEPNGDEYWYLNGSIHRLKGPAWNGGKEKRWFLYGNRYRTAQTFQEGGLFTDVEMAELIMKWGPIT